MHLGFGKAGAAAQKQSQRRARPGAEQQAPVDSLFPGRRACFGAPGSLPARLQDAGVIRHHGYGGSQRAHQSLVHVWIGVPADHREAVARRRREDRAARRAARAEQRKAAAA